ncbi:MAG TPA: phage tail tape measure protein, partial [Hyphomicrobiaceae bacterium]|nr:phage tail tape measure protein [Hyphomicrobiaceae bacterium]
MSAFSNLLVKLGLDAKGFEDGIKKANLSIRDIRKSEKDLTEFGNKFKDIGGKLTMGLSLPLVALGGVATKAFADFDSAMTQSLAIMGDVSDSMRGEMVAAAKQMSTESTFSAKQAAESFFFLASAGLDAEASVKALPVVTKFAQAGMFDMALATDLLTDAQSALGLTIRDDAVANMDNMVRVSDVLVKANNLANASVQQFSEALTNKAGAAMRTVGKDIAEGVAVLAAFADQGIKGAEAGTQFSIVLRDLQTKAIGNAAAFKEAGIAVFDANGEMNNLGSIIGDVETALSGMSDEQKKATLLMLGFSDKSVSALQALIGTSDAIKGYETALRSAGGTTEEVAGKQMESFSAQMTVLKNRITNMAIETGSALAPALTKLVDAAEPLLKVLEKAVKWFSDLPEPIQTIIIGIAALVAAIGPALYITGQLAHSIVAIKSALAVLKFTPIISGLTGMVGTMSGGGGLVALLGAAGPLAIALGVAIAGWALYKAITKMRELNAELERLEELERRGIKATAEQAAEIKTLEGILDKHRETVDSTGLSVEEYIDALREAAKETGDFAETSSGLSVTFNGITLSSGKAKAGVEEVGSSAKKGGEQAKQAAEEFRGLADTLSDIEQQKAADKFV